MLAVVRTPRTDLKIRGDIPTTVLKVLRHEFGDKLKIKPDPDDEKLINVFDTPEYKEFKKRIKPGDYIRTYRENYALTQADLGEKVGVSRAYICDIEHSRRTISKNMAKKFSKLFKISTDHFL